MKSIARVVHAIAALGCLIHAAPADRAVIESCRYTSDAAAQAVWQPMKGSGTVTMVTVAGRKALRMPCNYVGSQVERASWDRPGKLDLAPYQGIEFEFFAQNSAPVSHYSIYFQSGGGWYSASFFPTSKAGWETIHIDKAATRTEGNPAGWGSVTTIRVSAWRGRDENTEFYISDIRGIGVLGVDASVAIVRAEAQGKNEQEYAAGISGALATLGIRASVLSDSEVTAENLRAAKIVILPHNPTLPDRAAAALNQYLRSGGKLLVFYTMPVQLRSAVKIESGSHIRAQSPGQFAAMRFPSGALAGAPGLVGQRSWNINEGKPVSGASRTLAEWLDDKGQPSGYPAVIASANCIWMTHVLLKDDAVNKRRMLMAMVGQLAPELWRQSVTASIAQIGPIGPAKNFDEAAAILGRTAIAPIRKMRDEASALNKRGKYVEASDKAAAASGKLAEAFAKAQKPLPGEFRAFWCHSAMGVEGMDWDEAIRRLADNGFTAILPNMLWAGAAFYDSAVLPVASAVTQKGDQIAQCLTACKKVRNRNARLEGELQSGQGRARRFCRKNAQRGPPAGEFARRGRAVAVSVASGKSKARNRLNGRTGAQQRH